MRVFNTITFLLLLFFCSCQQSIDSDKTGWKDGLRINTETGKPLNGRYKSITPIGGTYSGNHVSTFEYEKGVPVGKWTYTFNGDSIHSGKYLNEKKVKVKITSSIKSKRTDLNLWEEGGFPMLNIDLIQPEIIDSIALEKIAIIAKEELLKKYEFNVIIVTTNNGQARQDVYELKLK